MNTLKKITLLFCLSSFILSSYAQTDQWNILIGGSSAMSLTSTSDKWKSDDDDGKIGKATQFAFSPMFGVFVINGLAVGVELQTGFQSYKYDDDFIYDYDYNEFLLAAGPFVRYYLLSGKIKPYGHLAIGGGIDIYSDDDPNDSDTYSWGVTVWEVGAGVGFFVNDHVSIDLGLLHTHQSIKAKEDNPENFKSINNEFGLNVGIVVVL